MRPTDCRRQGKARFECAKIGERPQKQPSCQPRRDNLQRRQHDFCRRL